MYVFRSAIIAIGLAGASIQSLAQDATLQSSVIGCGGVVYLQESATNHWLSCTIGQAVISGRSQREGIDRHEGFWVPWPSSIVSVEDEELANRLQAYPNPFSAATRIEIGREFAQDLELSLFTLAGEKVRSMRVDALAGEMQSVELTSVDDNNVPLASGQYICTVAGRTRSGSRVRTYTTVTVLK